MPYWADDDNTTNFSQAKIVSSIHQSDGGDETVLIIPAEWNKRGIVLRDRRVWKFVKYISRRAKSDSWDIYDEYSVIPRIMTGRQLLPGIKSLIILR